MAKRLAAVMAAVGSVALAVSLLAPAGADTNYSQVSFTVRERAADDVDKTIDVGPNGFSYGDYFVIGPDPLFNASLSTRVGTSNGDCLVTVIRQQSPLLECDVTFTVRGSHITVEGPFDFRQERATLAVTGGTGRYRTAHGVVHVSSTRAGLRFAFDLL